MLGCISFGPTPLRAEVALNSVEPNPGTAVARLCLAMHCDNSSLVPKSEHIATCGSLSKSALNLNQSFLMNYSSKVRFEFGPFRIDTQRHLVFRGNELVQLSPKPFQTLLVLVQNRHRVVKKEELIRTIWPDSYVEESNLAQNVSVLRKALGEQKNEHAYIMTVPGTGYRFVAPVTEFGLAERHIDDFIQRKSENVHSRPSIAVLPFEPLVEDGGDDALARGLTDALITRLSQLKNIRVRPTLSVLKYRDARHDTLRIGDELNVDSVVVGTFHRDGDQIRVSVQLVQVSDGVNLWAAKFDQNFTNLFSTQDSTSEQIVEALALAFGGIYPRHEPTPIAFHIVNGNLNAPKTITTLPMKLRK